MPDWLQANETLFWWGITLSLLTFFGTLIAVPILVARIPADYFAAQRTRPVVTADRRHPLPILLLLIVKNLLGALLLLIGILMLVLPGQGLLTMMMGLVLMNVPGKYRFERWLLTRRPVRRAVNWLRRRAGRAELKLG